ncbi:KPN_02809 family neutral zinc metallopeptidase [Kribbella sp. CA-293567]|uniref:KPN_02809 family neutral zinc metallopeptidase n=1 Tax=Kribbella sp. CA-293567 TaxID=3002436 RepID=UPI0022DE615F|nr:neutral zinc metallopeptidase [Kribbella sp. CA-293567]WBQ01820.1 neutral zinc metallopeptidase [Kribbella sp. CA-293567]
MKFNPDADLDTSGVEDTRGSGGGGGRLPGGMGIPVGGGIGGVVLLIIVLLLNGGLPGGGGGADEPAVQNTAAGNLDSCKKGSDLTSNKDCRFVFYQNSIQNFWAAELPRRGKKYVPAPMRVFDNSVNTGCGPATAAVGPFYCPPDKRVYLELGFFKTLQTDLGARGGDFAEAYVVAHEYGHHIQNLYGILGKIKSREGPESDSVRSELQADCLAGIWTNHATKVPSSGGKPLITELSEDDIARGLDAAASVGDDRIQEKTQGQVNPESFSHGTAEQRMKWFKIGMDSGDMTTCDTWSASSL